MDGRQRKMTKSTLLGQHSHETASGVGVNVYQRDGKYLVRGYVDGEAFGKTLGADEREASRCLHRLLVEIEDGTFVRPSELRGRQLKRGPVPRFTIRQLCDDFLVEKRKTKGKKTADTYRSRLTPLIKFSERMESRRSWSLAMDVDREFAISFLSSLASYAVTRNGHPGGSESPMSPRQTRNVLDCTRSLFHWAKRPEVNKLPSNFVNPFSDDIVGTRPKKDPLRPQQLPVDQRIRLVHAMDRWQLTHLVLSLVLPLRPEDCTGLLISDVDFQNHRLMFGTRMGGRDFNKGRQQFVVPFPRELVPLLRFCVDGRAAGPVLRRRAVFEDRKQSKLFVSSPEDVLEQFERALTAADSESVQTPQDQKVLFRSTLRQIGGTSGNEMNREFKSLLGRAEIPEDTRLYDLRGAVSTEMYKAGVADLTLRYVTGHTTGDILNEYISFDPADEVQKYFDLIRPLLDEIKLKARSLGIHVDKEDE